MARGSDKIADEGRKAFGQRVRSLRLEAELSQEALADLAGLHRTYLSDLERGQRNVGIDNILSLAVALGVPAASLFAVDD